ncbi:hypothetical protein ACFL0M_01660 [Thermodesulfobacteriota bacterium]
MMILDVGFWHAGLKEIGKGKSGQKYILLPYLYSAGRIPIFMMLILLFCCGVSRAEGANSGSVGSLSAGLDRNSAKVGSMVELTLSYRLPEGGRLPEKPQIEGLEGLTIRERVIGPDQIRIKLLVDRLGSWKSGPLSLTYVDKAEKKQALKTDPVSLTVLSNLGEKPEEAQLRPIQGIIPIRAVWLKYLPWGAGLLGILLVGAGVLWWHKRRRARQKSWEHEDPPHIRAQKEIEQLEARKLFEKGYIKGFYFPFSEILRRYLEFLRRFPAAEFTTEEIARHLDNEQDRKLLPLLRKADLVKFAESIPTLATKEEHVREALSYIRATSPVADNGRPTNLSEEAPR